MGANPSIDTRHHDIYVHRVEVVGGKLWSVEIEIVKNVKDPGNAQAKHAHKELPAL